LGRLVTLVILVAQRAGTPVIPATRRLGIPDTLVRSVSQEIQATPGTLVARAPLGIPGTRALEPLVTLVILVAQRAGTPVIPATRRLGIPVILARQVLRVPQEIPGTPGTRALEPLATLATLETRRQGTLVTPATQRLGIPDILAYLATPVPPGILAKERQVTRATPVPENRVTPATLVCQLRVTPGTRALQPAATLDTRVPLATLVPLVIPEPVLMRSLSQTRLST